VLGAPLGTRAPEAAVRPIFGPRAMSVPGIWPDPRGGFFAIGDVGSDSVKRVAAAVGDGAQVVAALHRFLQKADSSAMAPARVGEP